MAEAASAAASGAAIELRGVELEIGGRLLVRDLDFSVAAGETLVLLGRSGSGKTTTLKLVNRLREATRGEVRVEGKAVTAWDTIALRRRIGYVIQETGLFPHVDVEQNVGLVPRLEKWPEARIRARVHELLDLVGLPPATYARRFPAELSGGQRQRVGVARALALDPPIVLMDEPFGAVDPLTRLDLQRELSALAQKIHKTIVFVTHDVAEAFALATRIGLFHEGRLVELAEPAAFARSRHPEAVAFMETLDASGAALALRDGGPDRAARGGEAAG
ncbi:MAG: ATP-binding cassette domain-containing protein [Polyangiaceae bacterium]